MTRFPPDYWWFSRTTVRPVPSSLRIQLCVVTALYLLAFGLPGLADLLLNKGSYNALDWSYVIPAVCSSLGLLILAWYFVRIDGGTWRAFWNSRPVPNLVCFFVTLLIYGVAQWGSNGLTDFLIKNFHGLNPYRAVGSSTFPANLMIPTTAAFVLSEEIIARGYVITRVRQTGGGLVRAVLWSTLLSSTCHIGWGADIFFSSIASGILLGLLYARWGGLAGLIAGHIAWEFVKYFYFPLK
jgi:membrane protease YdiL (CAAX protease family)